MEGCIIFNFSATPGARLAFLLLAASKVNGADMPAIEFSVKPRICVLMQQEEACYDELEVRWQAKRKMNLCLYRSDFDKPLNCWRGSDRGAHKFVLSTSRNVTFHLREGDKGIEVSEAFEVIHDNRQYRRQRRNPWSFF